MKISARNQLEGTVRGIRRTKSLEDPCVPSRPFAWSLGEALQSGNSQLRRPGDDESTQDTPLVTATVTTVLLRANPGSPRRRSAHAQRYRLHAKGEA